MKEVGRLWTALVNIYLISSFNIIQVLCADRPEGSGSLGGDDTKNWSNQSRESRQFNDFDDFSPSIEFQSDFGQKVNVEDVQSVAAAGSSNIQHISDSHHFPDTYEFQGSQEFTYRKRPNKGQTSLRRKRYRYQQGQRLRPVVSRQDQDKFTSSLSQVSAYQKYFGSSDYQISRPPRPQRQRNKLTSILTPSYVRFSGERPQPLKDEDKRKDGGILDFFLGGSGSKYKEPESDLTEPSYEFVYNSIDDYDDREKDYDASTFLQSQDYDQFNIDYSTDQDTKQYDFKDVLYSIRNNETRIETLKKFLSAASGLTDRASTDPSFMLFNMPITVLSILGGFYALSAIAVIGYKYTLFTVGNDNGAAIAIIPVVISFAIPVLLVTLYLFTRGAINGQVSLTNLARGDFNEALRADFDPVSFVYDAAVGSTAILGLGWIVSVVI